MGPVYLCQMRHLWFSISVAERQRSVRRGGRRLTPLALAVPYTPHLGIASIKMGPKMALTFRSPCPKQNGAEIRKSEISRGWRDAFVYFRDKIEILFPSVSFLETRTRIFSLNLGVRDEIKTFVHFISGFEAASRRVRDFPMKIFIPLVSTFTFVQLVSLC